jgi:hypothetical protein
MMIKEDTNKYWNCKGHSYIKVIANGYKYIIGENFRIGRSHYCCLLKTPKFIIARYESYDK